LHEEAQMSTQVGTFPARAVENLQGRMRGELLQPDDPRYDAARRVFNAGVDRRPALIARCAGAADVIAAVAAGRELDVPIAVRGGGHSVAGHGTCEGGLLIDMSSMKGIHVDPASRMVRAQAGLTWGEFDHETQAFGMAVTGGRVSTTGIAGLTLGSGSGWIERRHGLSADNLLAADVVTADGGLLRATADENPDLFFGIRGGGGNFGIVTEFEYCLHPVGPIIYGGLIAHPAMRAPEFLRFYRELMAEASNEVGGAVAFVTAPPAPFVPPELHGKPLVAALLSHIGSPVAADRAAAALREFGKAPIDHLGPMPYLALQQMIDASNPPGLHNYWKAENVTALTDEAIDTLVEHVARMASPHSQVLAVPCGGAVADVDDDETAISGRSAFWQYHALAMWTDPAESATHIGWARDLAEAMSPYAQAGVSLNFTSDMGDDRVAETFGEEKIGRLREVKRTYDPGNVFRLNQNISP
jgi:FAD/FMN-containing dehydrogenase